MEEVTRFRQNLIAKASEWGACDAAFIDPKTDIFFPSVLESEFSSGKTVEKQSSDIFQDYEFGIVLEFPASSPGKRKEIETANLARRVIAELERYCFLEQYYRALGICPAVCMYCWTTPLLGFLNKRGCTLHHGKRLHRIYYVFKDRMINVVSYSRESREVNSKDTGDRRLVVSLINQANFYLRWQSRKPYCRFEHINLPAMRDFGIDIGKTAGNCLWLSEGSRKKERSDGVHGIFLLE